MTEHSGPPTRELQRTLLKFSHDLNNLLMGIAGYAKLLLSEGHIRSESEHLLHELIKTTDRATRMSALLQEKYCSQSPPAPLQAAHPFSHTSEKGSVLIIDDEEVMRAVFETQLTRAGYHVLCASSGGEAESLFERHMNTVRCILLDLSTLHMSINPVFARLKALNPEVQVVIMGGFVDRYALRQFAPGEYLSFLKKPFESEELLQVVSQCMNRVQRKTVGEAA